MGKMKLSFEAVCLLDDMYRKLIFRHLLLPLCIEMNRFDCCSLKMFCIEFY